MPPIGHRQSAAIATRFYKRRVYRAERDVDQVDCFGNPRRRRSEAGNCAVEALREIELEDSAALEDDIFAVRVGTDRTAAYHLHKAAIDERSDSEAASLNHLLPSARDSRQDCCATGPHKLCAGNYRSIGGASEIHDLSAAKVDDRRGTGASGANDLHPAAFH